MLSNSRNNSNKIEGQKLSDQILKLNNKELFEVTSNILCKFEGYKIPLDAIYMKTPNEFYINALECKLETTRKSIAEYIKNYFKNGVIRIQSKCIL